MSYIYLKKIDNYKGLTVRFRRMMQQETTKVSVIYFNGDVDNATLAYRFLVACMHQAAAIPEESNSTDDTLVWVIKGKQPTKLQDVATFLYGDLVDFDGQCERALDPPQRYLRHAQKSLARHRRLSILI